MIMRYLDFQLKSGHDVAPLPMAVGVLTPKIKCNRLYATQTLHHVFGY